jgi:FKBP-type peptidyl-prolyl cis-trans isomerase
LRLRLGEAAAVVVIGSLLLAACGGPVGEGNATTTETASSAANPPSPPPSGCVEGADSSVTSRGVADDFHAYASAQFTKTSDGLQYADVAPGTGPVVANGQCVTVQYTGWLSNGTKFDSSRDRSGGFQLVAGPLGQVIKGWQEGIPGIKVGGKRRLVIPPDLAYGPSGQPPTIPANSTLTFDIEVLRVH